MQQFKVGKITIYNALKLLAEEGIIKRVQGKGTFVNGVFGKSLTISGQVAVVMNHIGHYYSNLAENIRKELYKKLLFAIPVDYIYEDTFSKRKNSAHPDYLSLLLNSNIHGVIYDGNGYSQFPFMNEYTHLRSVSVNCFDASGDIPDCSVLIDFELGISQAVNYLLKKGSEKILFFTHRPKEFPLVEAVHAKRHPVNQMLKGYTKTMTKAGFSGGKEIICRDENYNDDMIRGVLSRPERPDAIICDSDIFALKIIMIAFTMGIKIPKEIAIIGMYNTQWAEESPLKITSLSFREAKIAKEAVRLIVGKERKKRVIIKPELIIREST